MRKLYKLAGVSLLCLAGCASHAPPLHEGPSPLASTESDATSDLSATVYSTNLQVGPGTNQSYTAEQLQALQKHAGSRITILSADDWNYLQNPEDLEGAKRQIASWIQKDFSPDDQSLGIIYARLEYGANPVTIPFFSSDPSRPETLIGAVIIIPESTLGAGYYRDQSRINFTNSLLDEDALKEARLFIAAHEATHVFLLGQDNNTEAGAEMGAWRFLSQHPSFFPLFTNTPTLAEQMLAGRRALAAFIAGGGGYDTDTASCSPLLQNCENVKADDLRLQQSRADAIRTIAQYMYHQKMLPPIDESSALEAAYGRFVKPWNHVTSEQRSRILSQNLKMDDTADTAWFFKKILKGKKFANKENEDYLLEAKQTLYPLIDEATSEEQNGKLIKAHEFLKKHHLSQEELDRLLSQGRVHAAPQHLENILRKEDIRLCSKYNLRLYVDPKGKTSCPTPSYLFSPDNAILHKAYQATSSLNANGTFAHNTDQQAFVNNLIAGFQFYLEPDSASVRPTRTRPNTPGLSPGN